MATLSPAQRRVLWCVGAAGALIFVVLGGVAQRQHLFDLERDARTVIQSMRQAALERPMKAVSRLSSGYVMLPVAGMLGALVWRRHRRLALSLGLAVAGAVVFAALAKLIVGRGRPNLVAYGYPSGHVFGVVIFCGMVLYLAWALSVSRWARRAAVLGSGMVIAAVSSSRLYVNAHWLTDVMGGLAGLISEASPRRPMGRRWQRALPQHVADEEGAEGVDVLRRLDRLPHRVDQVGQGVELAADETDDEVVVVGVEAVAGQADVVGEVGLGVGPAQHAVLSDDRPLLLGRLSGYQIPHGQAGVSAVRRGRCSSQSSRSASNPDAYVQPNMVNSGLRASPANGSAFSMSRRPATKKAGSSLMLRMPTPRGSLTSW
jgi:hypothetical protein